MVADTFGASTVKYRNIYTYNQVGDRSSDSLLLTKPAATTVQGKITWNYDNIRRLTATRYPKNIVGGDSAIYAYDQMGNRTSKVSGGATASYSYNWNNNELTSNGGTYSYDNNGNLVQKTLPNQSYYTYACDFENRLVKAKYTTLGSDSVTYEYDGLGQRRRKVGTSDTTRYTWDGLYPVVEWNNQGKLKQTFVYANGLLLGIVDSTVTTNKRYYVLHDGLGSSIALTDSTANIKRSLIYSDFGQSLVDTSASGIPTLNRLYAGYQWNGAPANLYTCGGRNLDVIIGRFASEEPLIHQVIDGSSPFPNYLLKVPSALNAFIYVQNNPINYIDPSGWVPEECRGAPEQDRIRQARDAVKQIIEDLKNNIMPSGKPVATTDCWPWGPSTQYEKGFNPCGCTERCVVAHETVHQDLCKELIKKYGKIMGPWKYLTTPRQQLELPAYEKQLECLNNLLFWP